jgi:hypothetical protein
LFWQKRRYNKNTADMLHCYCAARFVSNGTFPTHSI